MAGEGMELINSVSLGSFNAYMHIYQLTTWHFAFYLISSIHFNFPLSLTSLLSFHPFLFQMLTNARHGIQTVVQISVQGRHGQESGGRDPCLL